MMKFFLAAIFFLTTLTSAGAAATKGASQTLPLTRWLKNQDAGRPGASLAGSSADIAINWPGENRYSTPVKTSWRGWQRLEIDIQFEKDPPPDTDIWVYTKDWNLLWRQVRFQNPTARNGRVHLTIPITGDEADKAWQSVGHRRNWHCLSPEQIRVLGLKFENETIGTFSLKGKILNVSLAGKIDSPPVLDVRQFSLTPGSVRVGEACEASFEIPWFSGNPFDPEDFSIKGVITRPDGKTDTVAGFYKEPFILRPAGLTGNLLPAGRPAFSLRYTPRVEGLHKLDIWIGNQSQSKQIPTVQFRVSPPGEDYHGFLSVDAKAPAFISFEDGTLFQGLGVNTRSPTDTRHAAMVPHNRWQDEGLNFYRRVFPVYRQNGINVAEVWMSSWWLALEWIPDDIGNHGVGHYNQYRAFLLDQLIQCAEENDIYLILVFNNHGKFSTHCDEEWDRNPYNRANGGFLSHCEAYFSDPRALKATRNLIDYMVARWAHSPNILTWKLFSEINLTGASQAFYKTPPMREWHRRMANYFHQQDIYDHLVTTHWSSNYRVINEPIARLEPLDFLTTDAYTFRFGATDAMMEFLEGTAAYSDSLRKGVFITEFGGHPMGDSLPVLRRQLHLGNWYGFFNKMGVIPMMWWFAIIDEENFYPEYAAIRAFMNGEDPRGMTRTSTQMPGKDLKLEILQEKDRMLIWGYDTGYFMSDAHRVTPANIDDLSLAIAGLSPGTYTVEHWDCGTGKLRSTTSFRVPPKGSSQLKIPAFKADFAVKIYPAN